MTTRVSEGLTGNDLVAWNSYLLATRLLFEKLDQRLESESQISLPDYILLFRLGRAGEDGMRLGDLADSAVFSRSRISHAMNRLEKLGWVERQSCPTDRRGSYGVLTEQGRDKLDEAGATHDEVVRAHFLESLESGDRSAFLTVTDAMRDSLGGLSTDEAC